MQLFAERGRLERIMGKYEIRKGVIEAGPFNLSRCLSHSVCGNLETQKLTDICTRIGGEFEVVRIEPSSTVLRGGQSKTPVSQIRDEVNEAAELRDVDVFAELAVRLDLENETAEFQFKGIFNVAMGKGRRLLCQPLSVRCTDSAPAHFLERDHKRV